MGLFSYKYVDAEPMVVDRVARYIVCNPLSKEDIYTKNGSMRMPVVRKCNDVKKVLFTFLNTDVNREVYKKLLIKYNLMTSQNVIKKKDLFKSADILYQMYEKRHLLQDVNGMSVNSFLQEYNIRKGDVVGVYVIYNSTKEMYYVGQAKRLYFRVRQHFTGHGNGDVYADYKYGDDFFIQLLPLSESGYSDLDLFEKDMIYKYGASTSGYNKTIGNG